MKVRHLIIAASAGLMLASCNKDEGGTWPADLPRDITVEAQIGNMTRATTDGVVTTFETGDAFKLYAWTDNQNATPQSFVVNGVDNTLGEDGKWTPAVPMLWADFESLHYFLGVYPKRTVDNFLEDPFSLGTDYEQNDLLAAVLLNGQKAHAAANEPTVVHLTFDHMMAKFYVNMTFNNQWGGNKPTIESCIAEAATSCTVNYLAQSVTPGTKAELPLQPETTASNLTASYSSIMIPTATDFSTIRITIDGKVFSYTHPTPIPLSSGKFTTLNLVVGRDKIEVGSISIANWDDSDDVIQGGEALDNI